MGELSQLVCFLNATSILRVLRTSLPHSVLCSFYKRLELSPPLPPPPSPSPSPPPPPQGFSYLTKPICILTHLSIRVTYFLAALSSFNRPTPKLTFLLSQRFFNFHTLYSLQPRSYPVYFPSCQLIKSFVDPLPSLIQ